MAPLGSFLKDEKKIKRNTGDKGLGGGVRKGNGKELERNDKEVVEETRRRRNWTIGRRTNTGECRR